jgi:hypothetical protein
MKSWRSSGWLAALVLGYALLYVVHYAETAYSLQTGANADSFRMVRALFLKTLACAPCAWFAEGPCQRLPHLSVALLLIAGALLAIGYLGALRSVSRRPGEWPLRRILGWAALAALPLLLLLPPTSIDYAAYILNGRVASVYHVSPWHHPLKEFPAEDRYVAACIWGADLKCNYGPTFVLGMALLTGISHLLAPGAVTPASFLLNVLLLRAFNVAVLVAAAVAIWRINGLCWPRQQRLVTAAFLLNPLLAYEGIATLHNDLWGMMLLLWACYLFLRADTRFLVPLSLSLLTKYLAVFAVPFLGAYYVRRRDWRRIGWLAAALLANLVIIQFTAGENLARLVKGARGSDIESGPFWVARLIAMVCSAPEFPTLVGWMGRLLIGLFVIGYLVLLWRTHTRRHVLLHSAWALGVYFVAVHLGLKLWYLLWPVGLLFTIQWTRATANLAWATSLTVLSYVSYFWHHNNWHSSHSLPIQACGYVALAVLPVLAGVLGQRGWWSVCEPAEEEVDGKARPHDLSRGSPSRPRADVSCSQARTPAQK